MKIIHARVQNYKSIFDSSDLEFSDGFNVIIGQNNAGKAALLEALSLKGGNKPHRSLRTFPSALSQPTGQSIVDITVEFTRSELLDLLADQLPSFHVPWPQNTSPHPYDQFVKSLSDSIQFSVKYVSGVVQHTVFHPFNHPLSTAFRITAIRTPKGVLLDSDRQNYSGVNPATLLNMQLAVILKDRIYAFRAERLNVGTSQFGAASELSPDARNLPEVLNMLQGNYSRFEKFNQYVRTVFPEIKRISVRPTGSTSVEIRVWNVDPETERDDLTVSLTESGTGIGQVLAILYVVLTADQPRVILIDEPQSFLHPGAVRKLIDLLKRHSEHQFIVTSHSPTVITASNPTTLTLIRKNGPEAVFENVNMGHSADLRVVLAEVGARLGDVFGADYVLWVEGRTEELCFPMILERIAKKLLLGTQILGVMHTGDFDSRHSRTAFDVYRRLSSGRGLLPPAIGFIFDREGRTLQQLSDLQRESGGTVKFLSRRMYENYLLSPAAIAYVASQITGFRQFPIRTEEIQDWLDANRWERKYFTRTIREDDWEMGKWLATVHGADVLKDIFRQFSEERVTYDKVEHGVLLTNWIITNDPELLREIADLLSKLVPETP